MKNKPNSFSALDDRQTKTALEKILPENTTNQLPPSIGSRFEYISILGKGGGGEVFLVYDHKLQRKVALKHLNSTDQLQAPFLLREARLQAQIKHPNICQIHEICESQKQIYIVMQYINGQALHKIYNQLTIQQKLLVINKILNGLQQAHKQGIIHRDIKPSNILVEVSDNNEITPYLIDFGLAYREQNETQIVESIGLGTPNYMSPEQIASKISEIDHRTDIYAIGATLYHILTEKLPNPFSDSNTVQSNNSFNYKKQTYTFSTNIPKDLQTIIIKCLQVNPEKRYSSAEILANEIMCYLNGDPIQDYSGWSYKVSKKLRKYKLIVLLTSLFFITIVASAVWFIYLNHQQGIRENIIQEFSADVENMEARVRFTYMAPRHDISPQIQQWQNEIKEIENKMNKLGEIAYGPGHYAIGRMYYALQDYDKALTSINLAWQSGFQQPRVAYLLALTNGAIYQRQKNTINNLPDKSARQEKLVALDKKYRQPAIQLLKHGIQASPYLSYAQAMLHFYLDEYDKSLAILKKTNNFPTWFYQHKVLIGDIYQAKSQISSAAHLSGEITQYTNLALNSYQQAQAIAPSDFQLQLKTISLYMTRITSFLYGKMGDFKKESTVLRKSLEIAKEINAQNEQTYLYHGQLLLFKSHYENQHSGNPIETINQAIEQLTLAKEKSTVPKNIWLALAYTNKFSLLQERNLNIENTFIKASNAFEETTPSQKGYFYYNEYGNLLKTYATSISEHQTTTSIDYFEKAVNAYNKALQLKPDRITSFINVGSTYRLWSNITSPIEAKNKLNNAIKKYQVAIELNKNHFVANYYLGMSYRRLAKIKDILFEDNKTAIKQAEYFINNALTLGSQHPFAVNELAMLESDQAVYLWQQGMDYHQHLNNATKRIKETLNKNPNNHILHATLASIYFNWCQLDFFSGKLSKELVHKTDKAIDTANQFSDYNKIDELTLRLLEKKTVSHKTIKDINKTDDRSLLLKAIWHSTNNSFESANAYFSQIKQLPPSILWSHQQQHLIHWHNNKKDNKITKLTLDKLNSLIKKLYPALVNKQEVEEKVDR
ncbi:protein kinase domain-containing protein [Aliikangiella sp. IMCC44359]|uniref:protein kinase domain-containing protein n=1 Tax=Aliikangiella sp. IMCC44359 TaxID=3459125 RepID=UPI00403B319C